MNLWHRNSTTGLSEGQNVGAQTRQGCQSLPVWCPFRTWMDMGLWEAWLCLEVDELLLYKPYDRIIFSNIFLFSTIFCIYHEVSWLQWAVSAPLPKSWEVQVIIRAGAWCCHSIDRPNMGLGRFLLISTLIRRFSMVSDGNSELEESFFIRNFSWEYFSL